MKKYLIILLLFAPFTSIAQRGKYVASIVDVKVPDAFKAKLAGSIVGSRTYKDSLINITWQLHERSLGFLLENISPSTLKVIWDEAAFIDAAGSTGKVMHHGIKFIDRNNSQVPSSIISGANLEDVFSPTDKVYYAESSGWRQRDIIPSGKKNIPLNVGKTIKALLPVQTNGQTVEYIFTFKIDWEEKAN